jgi:lipopolysaccharide transport system permease protein
LLAVNPMTAVIAGFRWCVLNASAPDLGQTLVSIAAAVVFFILGLAYFRRSEPKFADTI